MATTRIMSMHVNRGKTIAQCLTDRTSYIKNKEKTNDSELITAFACDHKTADAEFLYAKRQYKLFTGRDQKSNVIAYQIRQSFRPGETTPEEANLVGYELAERFLKGKHAFIVATHIDKKHIHNHIIFNSTTLDCHGKFRDFLGSGKAVAKVSDLICMEHGLSVIENPKRGNNSYNKWLGTQASPSHRELLRTVIDDALKKKPRDFNMFLDLMRTMGYTVKTGKHLAFTREEQKQAIRLRSLGDGYSEADIRAVLAGEKNHSPRKKYDPLAKQRNSLLIDIEAKLQAGKGGGYERWAKKYNLKQMAQTLCYLEEHRLLSYTDLTAKAKSASERFNTLSTQIKNAESRMAEIAVLKTHIINYSKTREVYTEYRKAGYSKKFLAKHESEIILHKAAKKAFDALELAKLPTVKHLQAEYATLLTGKKTIYAEYRAARVEMRELLVHKANVDNILGTEKTRVTSLQR